MIPHMKVPCACTTVRKANRALFRFYERAMEGSGMSITQFSIARTLDRNGPTPLSELAEELVMERTSLYRTIAPLNAIGAIDIEAAETGRAKFARLTCKGKKLMLSATPNWQRAQDIMINAIGESDWQKLSIALLKIPGLVDASS